MGKIAGISKVSSKKGSMSKQGTGSIKKQGGGSILVSPSSAARKI